jgi:hypothetical protein
MIFYLERLFDQERVPLETALLFNLQSDLSEISTQFILKKIQEEKSNKRENSQALQNQFCESINILFIDINQYHQNSASLLKNEKENNLLDMIIEAEN